MSELVQENLSSSRLRQRSWFDKGARLRLFTPGDSVLVLLPTSSNRLLAQWQGSFQVGQRMGKVNYLIDMQDRRKRKRVFHVHMLKDFHVRENRGCFVEEMQEEADIPSCEAGQVVDIGEGLDSGQKKELKKLLGRFAKIFSQKRLCMSIGFILIVLSLLDCLRTGCRMPKGFYKKVSLKEEWN